MKSFITTLALGSMIAIVLSACGLGVVSAPIQGTVAGLTGGTVGLLDNGGDAVSVSANGTFTFPTQLKAGAAYNVSVGTQPSGQTCAVTGGSGTVDQNADAITGVTVNCVTSSAGNYIYGSVSGLALGNFVTLLLNGTGGPTDTVSNNGAFIFPGSVAVGSTFVVTVSANSPGQTCLVTNGSGTVPSSGTQTSVLVTCE